MSNLDFYLQDFRILVPFVAIFIIIFSLVMRSLREMDMFPAASRLVMVPS